MARREATLFVLVWLLTLHGLAIYRFTSGFLLTKHTVLTKSSCRDLAGEYDEKIASSNVHGCASSRDGGWDRGAMHYKRVVVLLVDALRHSFAAYDSSYWARDAVDDVEWFHRNKLPVLAELEQGARGGSGMLYKLVADAPTTTMQRLKAIATGGLPTFIELGSNFNAGKIDEDNIVRQWVSHNVRLAFLGDDTWEALFPGMLLPTNHTFPSFNVKDLHTVDNGILKYLLPTIQGEAEWDVLVAHFLGVDHCGHRYGARHPEMASKLAQMNTVIGDVAAALDDDTLLVVLGDHGMTEGGDHGGSSAAETDAALFVYSKRPNTIASLEMLPPDLRRERTEKKAELSQIDLVPTLSLILDVPIPYGNLGAVVPEWLCSSRPGEAPELPEICQERALSALEINARQINRYITDYARLASLPREDASFLGGKHYAAQQKWNTHNADPHGTTAQETGRAFHAYLRSVAAVTRRLWASFDEGEMHMGLGMLAAATACLVLHMLIASSGEAPEAPVVEVLAGAVLGVFVVGINMAFRGGLSLNYLATGYVFGSASGYLGRYVRPQWRTILTTVREFRPNTLFVGGLAILALHCAALVSNSFIEAERDVVHFLIVSGVVLLWREGMGAAALPVSHWTPRCAALALCVLLSRFVTVCRPEVEVCDSPLYFGNTASVVLAAPIPLLLVFLLYRLVTSSGNSLTQTWRVVIVPILVSATLVTIYWVTATMGPTFHGFRQKIAWMVYPATWVPLLAFGSVPVLVKVAQQRTKQTPLGELGGEVVVLGFKTVLAAPVFIVLTIIAMPLMMLLGPQSAVAMMLLLAQVYFFLDVAHAVRYATPVVGKRSRDAVKFGVRTKTGAPSRSYVSLMTPEMMAQQQPDEAASASERRPISLLVAVMWALFSVQYFFTTGHAHRFESLHFDAAFVGFDTFHSQWFNGLLVAANTCASHIIFAAALPLILVWGEQQELTDYVGDTSKPPLTTMRIAPPYLAFLLYYSLSALVTTAFVTIESRHLMVFKVFAPKYAFDSGLLIVVNVLLAVSFLFVRVVVHHAVQFLRNVAQLMQEQTAQLQTARTERLRNLASAAAGVGSN